MSSRFSYTSNFTKLIIVIEFALVSYLLYSLTKNIYNSYQVDQVIESFQKENSAIEEENRKKNADYLYFTSEEYIDKIAKQNLGLVDKGEEVIILSEKVTNPQQDQSEEDSAVTTLSRRSKMSNPEQWWDFFFGR
ncbi:septum formation initiator family protein [Candidatus Gracilibacteria bacterium]|jgi:cell division protein FtsB|nr:septum formation initiator family protein [Candidatus Gracilibacteria bacterium]